MNNKRSGKKNRRQRSAGFTLVEIMVVVVILGLLATLVTLNAPSIIHNQRVKAAKQNIVRLQNAVDMYYTEKGKFPSSLEDLVGTADKSGIKFIKKVPKDPWGNDFIFRTDGCPGNEEYCLSSLGADGVEGGDGKGADINSWELEKEENK